MATGYGGVTYQQMVEYVARVTDPMEDHMTAHDTWHRDRLTAEEQANKANFRANLSIYIAAVAVVVTIIFGLWRR